MPDDLPFRDVLIAGLLVVFPIGLYHRIRSHATGESLDRRQEGWFILITLRLVGVAVFAALASFLFDPALMRWSSVALPRSVRWTGVGLFAIAAALMTWAMHTLGPNLTDTVVTRQEHTLVTHGPYRWVRHPFYDTAALLAVSLAMVTANWFVLLAGVLALALLVVRTRIEEDKLLDKFGGTYERYRERTGRFLPKRPVPPSP